MDFYQKIWLFLQIIVGYNLIMPLILYIIWMLRKVVILRNVPTTVDEIDYGIIVTAYQQTHNLQFLVDSISKLHYENYLVYIIADNCDVSQLHFKNSKIILIRPPEVLASNTKSHLYAMNHFIRDHDRVTIIDSDNLLHKDFLKELNIVFEQGFVAVQGERKAKNTNNDIATLDAIRDCYYHFYDGKILFEIGSSATLSGSGMAFESKLYYDFLLNNQVIGAGFDKVLQSWLVKQKYRIAFHAKAVVYDEKTSRPDQLVKQRSRWIGTWFKYSKFGFRILFLGIVNLNINQFFFGIILLRPPLFIFIITSVLFMVANIWIDIFYFWTWVFGFCLFVLSFLIALRHTKLEAKAFWSLLSIPRFVYFQFVSLLNIRRSSKKSIATTHYFIDEVKNSSVNSDESSTESQKKEVH